MGNHRRPRILIYDQMAAHCIDSLNEVAEVDIQPDLTDLELLTCIGEYDALATGYPLRLTGSMIERGVRLKAIGYAASRLDNVDESAARGMGIEVFNAPASSAIAIAEQSKRVPCCLCGSSLWIKFLLMKR